MPTELLTFPPAYCVVGAYRLARDPLLWQPMWKRCSSAAKRAGLVALIWVSRAGAAQQLKEPRLTVRIFHRQW